MKYAKFNMWEEFQKIMAGKKSKMPLPNYKYVGPVKKSAKK